MGHKSTALAILLPLALCIAVLAVAEPPTTQPVSKIFDLDGPRPELPAWVAAAPPAKPPKHAVPSPASLSIAAKQVNELYADEIAKASVIEVRKALVTKLIAAAHGETHDTAAEFALLSRARDLAADADDLRSAVSVIEEMDKSFLIDSTRMQGDAAITASKAIRTPTDQKAFAAAARDAAEQAEQADRYDIARQLAQLSLSAARQVSDARLLQDLTLRVQRLDEAQSAYPLAKRAEAILKVNPTDADANLRAGRFRCFIRGDWDAGLPHLVLSADAKLKALAIAEMKAEGDPEAQVTAADGWWDAAEKESGFTRGQIRAHAASLYEKADPELGGLAKARAEQRIRQVTAALPSRPPINLLRLVEIQRDVVGGVWHMRDGALECEPGKFTRIELPYRPPEEYDFRIVFARVEGDEAIQQVCSAAGHQFIWIMGGWGNSTAGFSNIDKKPANENPTAVSLSLAEGRHYTALVQVRKGGVQAFLDGKVVASLKTDYEDMTLPKRLNMHHKDTLGLSVFASHAIFYSAEVIEVAGSGEPVR